MKVAKLIVEDDKIINIIIIDEECLQPNMLDLNDFPKYIPDYNSFHSSFINSTDIDNITKLLDDIINS